MEYLYIDNIGKNIRLPEHTVMTIGNFDGVHLGHISLIQSVLSYARTRNLPSLVLSFDPHPLFVLSGQRTLCISAKPEKLYVLESLGVDLYAELRFDNSIAIESADRFAEEIIFKKLGCAGLFVGEGFRFGKNKLGDESLLKKIGAQYGALVEVVPNVRLDGEKVSSSNVRQCIQDKDFACAERLMGRPYFIMGMVVPGQRLGREMGFPTVNIVPQPEKLLPPNGVYITKTRYNDRIFEGITNIGVKPTVGGRALTVETHLFDFDESLYGCEVRICFYKWLRDEMNFNSIDVLKAQIEHDTGIGKRYWNSQRTQGTRN